MPTLSLQPIADSDLPFVHAMLYAAAFWREDPDAPPIEEAMLRADLAVYVEGWGRPGDRGLVARIAGEPAGAVWVRLFDDQHHGYGYVDDQTPELSIAVAKDHRGRGVGRSLMAAMFAQARLDGVPRISLSVEVDNPAAHLYESVGFVPADSVEGAVTMVRSLR